MSDPTCRARRARGPLVRLALRTPLAAVAATAALALSGRARAGDAPPKGAGSARPWTRTSTAPTADELELARYLHVLENLEVLEDLEMLEMMPLLEESDER